MSAPQRVGRRPERKRSNAVLVYAIVLISLQIFLLVVAVEGFLGDEDHLAVNAAVLSSVLFGIALAFGYLVRDG